MLHHSLTKDTATVSWDAIRRYHIEVNGWKDIGYHFGVELVGSSYQILQGRNLATPGAHCKEQSMNRLAIGICVVGNFDLAPPPPEQLIALRSLVKTLMQEHNIPVENIVLHRQYATYKSCPGKLFPVAEFLASLNSV
jgi:N-acetyl-anhydromuramyl-L-alanine amidase AmpD